MFDKVLADIEKVFADTAWTALNIPTFPMNYQGQIGNGVTEYVMINVLPSKSDNYAHDAKKKLEGLIAVKIFVGAGNGQGRLMEIADAIDTVLDNKRITIIAGVAANGTELGTSYLNVEGLDPSNKALYSASYFIPFTLYGE